MYAMLDILFAVMLSSFSLWYQYRLYCKQRRNSQQQLYCIDSSRCIVGVVVAVVDIVVTIVVVVAAAVLWFKSV